MATQNSINLIAGTNITLTPSGSGLTIDASGGGVTPVSFSASLDTTILNATGNGGTYSFTGLNDTVTGVTNTGQFNPATGTFLCDAAGVYFFSVAIFYANIALSDQALLQFNLSTGVQIQNVGNLVPTTGLNGGGQYFSVIFNMAVGNTVTCTASVTGEVGNTLTIVGNDSAPNPTIFNGFRIS